jgi:hypothetical protein
LGRTNPSALVWLTVAISFGKYTAWFFFTPGLDAAPTPQKRAQGGVAASRIRHQLVYFSPAIALAQSMYCLQPRQTLAKRMNLDRSWFCRHSGSMNSA